MTTISHGAMRDLMPTSIFGRISKLVVGFLSSSMAAYRNRQLLGDFAQRDDYLLRDMGLTRADIEHAMIMSITQDPASFLMRARNAR